MRAALILSRARLSWAALVMAALSAGCSNPKEEAPCAGPFVICPLAGTGEAGFNGDGLPPLETRLDLPTAARVGPDGLLYVMDFNNMRLRRRSGGGAVETIVGSGVHAFAIAGADARATPLENPIDFAFGQDGSVIFVSLHDPRILTLTPDGKLDVVAGTGEEGDTGDGDLGIYVKFMELSGIAVAPDGRIFVSDDEANRVRVVSPDRRVQAFAGTGEAGDEGDGGPALAARLNHPEGLALDDSGNLYIADTYNHRIRRVDAETGLIETWAGVGTAGLSGDGGPAISAELHFPEGVSAARDGAIFISDTFNHRVRRVDAEGIISTFAGSVRGHSGDGGPAVEAELKGPTYIEATDEALYIADTQNQVVRVVSLQ